MATAVIPERGCLKCGAGSVTEKPGRLKPDTVDIRLSQDCLRLDVGGRDCGTTEPGEWSREDERCGWNTHGNLTHVVDD